MLEASTPAVKLDNSRILYFDEIAFMLGKWENVKNKPLASAISVSNLDGQIIKSPIIIGGDDILTKSQPTSLCDLQLPTVLKKTGIASIDETLAAYFEDPLTNTDLHTPTTQASKAASDNGMDLIGVNKSAYFKTSSFLHSLALLSKYHNASPFNPIVCHGDGAKIHVAVEVRNVLLSSDCTKCVLTNF